QDSEALYRQAVKLGRRFLDKSRAPWTMHMLADLLVKCGNITEAEQLRREAFAIAKEAMGEDHPSTDFYRSELASALEAQAHWSESELLRRDSLAFARNRYADDP